ncbi:MAG: recombination-associated protein RdgC [Pseudomonadota bacterium]
MFSNIRFYRLHSDWPDDEAALSDKLLSSAAFTPCGALTERSMGFEPPIEGAGDLLSRTVAGCDLLQLRIQSRVLPTAAINESLEERIASFTRRTGLAPNRKEKRDLKDEVFVQLLPQALLKSDRIRAFYIKRENVLAVGSASATVAEDFLSVLRDALGSVQAIPLEFKRSTGGLLASIFLGQGPEGFGLGRECRMKDTSDPKASVNWLDMDLGVTSVRNHVKNGLVIDRLGMQFDTVLRLTLDEELIVRKLRVEGVEALEEIEDEEDPLARFDAEFAMESGLVTRLIQALKKELGGFNS